MLKFRLFIGLASLICLANGAFANPAQRFEAFLEAVAERHGWELTIYGLTANEDDLSFDWISVATPDENVSLSLLGGAASGLSETEEGLFTIESLSLGLAELIIKDMPVAYNVTERREGLEYSLSNYEGPMQLILMPGADYFDLSRYMPEGLGERTPDTELRAVFDGISLYLNQGIRFSEGSIALLSVKSMLGEDEVQDELTDLQITSFADGLAEGITAESWHSTASRIPRSVKREGVTIERLGIRR